MGLSMIALKEFYRDQSARIKVSLEEINRNEMNQIINYQVEDKQYRNPFQLRYFIDTL